MIWYGKQLVARLIYLPAIIAAQVTALSQTPTWMYMHQEAAMTVLSTRH